MNISPRYKTDRLMGTPVHQDGIGERLSMMKFDSMGEKNTLTGIIRCIEDGLGELIVGKR